MRIFMNSKIRESILASPCEETKSPSPPDRKIPRKRYAPRRVSSAPVIKEEVLGVSHSEFEGLSPEAWNRLVAVWGGAFRKTAAMLSSAYSEGLESRLGRLLDQEIPAVAYALGRSIIELLLNRERGFYGSKLSCRACEGMLEYQGDRHRAILTRLGDVRVNRSYYVGSCGHTVFPLDELLGLEDHGILPELKQLIALQSSRVPYQEAVVTLTGLLPIHISLHTAKAVTHHVSCQVQAEQNREREEAFGDPACARLPTNDAPVSAPVAVVAADGGFCRTRQSEDPYKEFKLGVLGTLCPNPSSEDDKKAKVQNKRYVAHFGDADTLFEYLSLEYHRAGLQHAPILQVLGDGALWLWSRFESLREKGQEYVPVLDFYHASEHVKAASDALFGPSTIEGKHWYERMRKRLLEGNLRFFFRELRIKENRATAQGRSEAAQGAGKAYRYFQERRCFLRYKECGARGFPIGSGMVEGGIRFVGKDRLDRTGMRWSISGAEDILQLRCLSASNRWDSFFQKKARERLDRFQQRKTNWLRLRAA